MRRRYFLHGDPPVLVWFCIAFVVGFFFLRQGSPRLGCRRLPRVLVFVLRVSQHTLRPPHHREAASADLVVKLPLGADDAPGGGVAMGATSRELKKTKDATSARARFSRENSTMAAAGSVGSVSGTASQGTGAGTCTCPPPTLDVALGTPPGGVRKPRGASASGGEQRPSVTPRNVHKTQNPNPRLLRRAA